MKAIIKNGVANKDIQSCLISECGVEITFHNNDLADKFALSLNLSGIPCVNNGNKITISYIDQLRVVNSRFFRVPWSVNIVVFNRYLMRYTNQDDGAPTLT